MDSEKNCDFCGLSEIELPPPKSNVSPKLRLDEDGLWVCYRCQSHITTPPIGRRTDNSEMDIALQPLVGKSAGAICRTLELPVEPPYQAVIEAASKIAYDQDQYMSAWLFVDLWLDGTTLWKSNTDQQIAVVSPDGTIQIDKS
jgi:hypothetical protein